MSEGEWVHRKIIGVLDLESNYLGPIWQLRLESLDPRMQVSYSLEKSLYPKPPQIGDVFSMLYVPIHGNSALIAMATLGEHVLWDHRGH
jgi:hypothetical protein